MTIQAHKATLHGGTQLTQQYLRQRYWLLGGRNAVKSTIVRCIPCFRQRKQTRAAHLELVSDMTTEAFLAAFTRFSSRRGRVKTMFADNGTNFQGASNEQLETYAAWRKISARAETTTKWKFIPPSSPHMGGLHEAAVKSAKSHLRRVIGAQQLTYEQLATLLVQVEACLNSRPIHALTEDASDSVALTPGHFLIGEPIVSPLSRDYTHVLTNRLKRFQLIAKMTQDFWARWSNEYITTLMVRNKWQQSQTNVKENDIVLIASETLPPTQWPLGRVVNAIKGDDGCVRVVDVISRGTTYRRPIVKICVLPIKEPDEPAPAGEDVQT